MTFSYKKLNYYKKQLFDITSYLAHMQISPVVKESLLYWFVER